MQELDCGKVNGDLVLEGHGFKCVECGMHGIWARDVDHMILQLIDERFDVCWTMRGMPILFHKKPLSGLQKKCCSGDILYTQCIWNSLDECNS